MRKKYAVSLLLVLLLTLSTIVPFVVMGEENGQAYDEVPAFCIGLEDALYQEFGTIDPLEIGEESYTNFLNNFVNTHNERVQKSLEEFALLYDEGVAPRSMSCPGCGRWGSPSTVITATGPWSLTGNTRTSGTFPNQFIENEQSRQVTRETTGPCGILLARSNSTEFRWVRA